MMMRNDKMEIPKMGRRSDALGREDSAWNKLWKP